MHQCPLRPLSSLPNTAWLVSQDSPKLCLPPTERICQRSRKSLIFQCVYHLKYRPASLLCLCLEFCSDVDYFYLWKRACGPSASIQISKFIALLIQPQIFISLCLLIFAHPPFPHSKLLFLSDSVSMLDR